MGILKAKEQHIHPAYTRVKLSLQVNSLSFGYIIIMKIQSLQNIKNNLKRGQAATQNK